MSRLYELIEKLCPDGAEFLTLQECTQKVKNIKWKSYSGNDKKYIDLSSVDRDLHCIMGNTKYQFRFSAKQSTANCTDR